MRKVTLDIRLCERLVRHTASLEGLVEYRFLHLVKMAFSRTYYDVLFMAKKKVMEVDDNFCKALNNLDKAVIAALTDNNLPEATTEAIYKDFTALKLLIG